MGKTDTIGGGGGVDIHMSNSGNRRKRTSKDLNKMGSIGISNQIEHIVERRLHNLKMG